MSYNLYITAGFDCGQEIGKPLIKYVYFQNNEKI